MCCLFTTMCVRMGRREQKPVYYIARAACWKWIHTFSFLFLLDKKAEWLFIYFCSEEAIVRQHLFHTTHFSNRGSSSFFTLTACYILTRTFLFLCINGACPQLNNLVPSRDRRLTHSRANQLLIQGYQNLHQVLL